MQRPARVSKWRQRFGERRLDGLRDADRKGRPTHYDKTTEKRVLTLLDESPPEGYGSGPVRCWRRPWETLATIRSGVFCASMTFAYSGGGVGVLARTQEFGPKAADIVGLYLNPPGNALVLCVDEKPSIQALERHKAGSACPMARR